MFKVFYSWQSELPGRTNRHLIQEALENACRDLRREGSILIDPVVDRDSLGLAGAPDIREAILSKIQDADAFVADVSLISRTSHEVSGPSESVSTTRSTPNPNVLTELGFAMATMGAEALVLVVNTHFGAVDHLPFDLRPLRVLAYNANPEASTAAVKKELVGDFKAAVSTIGAVVRDDPLHALIFPRTQNVAGQAEAMLRELIKASGKDFEATTITEAELHEVCSLVNPNGQAPLLLAGNPTRNASWIEYLIHYRMRSKAFTDEILFFASLLKRDHLALLATIEYCAYFKQLAMMSGSLTRNEHFGWLAPSIWRYLLASRDLKEYAARTLARRASTF